MLTLKSCAIVLLLTACFAKKDTDKIKDEGLLVVTVATEATDGFTRFMASAAHYQLDVEVLGMGQEWKGGDMEHSTGGGQKVLLFREFLERVKDKKDLIVLFTDSYDVVFSGGEAEILRAFRRSEAGVLFSAEGFCWPDQNLANEYPAVKYNEKRYLNSGGFMGSAPLVYSVVTSAPVTNTDDDQLFYTKAFLDRGMRDSLKLKLDTRNDLFMPMHGNFEEVSVKFKGGQSYLYNSKTGNIPLVIHGNGPIGPEFNMLTSYLSDGWTMTAGCRACKEGTISLEGVKDEDLPPVFMALFVNHASAFLDEFFAAVANLDYPKARIDLFLHYSHPANKPSVDAFVERHGMAFNSIKLLTPAEKLTDWTSRNVALAECEKLACKYYFALDGDVQLEVTHLLKHAIQTNRSVVGPFVGRPGKLWSNFWGALNKDGFYKRSDNYLEITQGKQRGLWNVPYMSSALLVQGHHIPLLQGGYVSGNLDADMAFAKSIRDKNIFMFVDNQEHYGFLVNNDNYDTTHHHNDLYSIFDNQYAWEKKYIHADYRSLLEAETVIDEPCTDVFWMPIVSETYCRHLIEEMEHYGQWSGGKAEDPRLAGGYENVPTVDIHMNQIGHEEHWLHFLKEYVAPLNAKLYAGYYTDSKAIMNFVVRYRTTEQDRLRPHHDASTYTINVALNRVNIDYTGGGVRFPRYNCSVTALRRGWMLMHPGRLTHLHEGLPTTGGTRYIMISFIDP